MTEALRVIVTITINEKTEKSEGPIALVKIGPDSYEVDLGPYLFNYNTRDSLLRLLNEKLGKTKAPWPPQKGVRLN